MKNKNKFRVVSFTLGQLCQHCFSFKSDDLFRHGKYTPKSAAVVSWCSTCSKSFAGVLGFYIPYFIYHGN
jgi:hypothetical protein